jgi:hypothetical protein
MPKTRAPDPPVLRLEKCSFRNFAELRSSASELRVFVPYTSRELTRAALAEAAVLVKNLNAHVTLFAVQIVPFLLPLERPPVAPEFLEQKLLMITKEMEAQVNVQLVFARDLDSGIQKILAPSSFVIVATKKRWWRTAETKLARALSRGGHDVAVLEV